VNEKFENGFKTNFAFKSSFKETTPKEPTRLN